MNKGLWYNWALDADQLLSSTRPSDHEEKTREFLRNLHEVTVTRRDENDKIRLLLRWRFQIMNEWIERAVAWLNHMREKSAGDPRWGDGVELAEKRVAWAKARKPVLRNVWSTESGWVAGE